MKAHFICLGDCEGSSKKTGTCQAEDCPLYGKPLVMCDCPDGEHAELLEKDEIDEEDE